MSLPALEIAGGQNLWKPRGGLGGQLVKHPPVPEGKAYCRDSQMGEAGHTEK